MKWIRLIIAVVLLAVLSGCGEFGAYLKNGDAFLDQGKYDDASSEYQKAIDMKPDNEKALRGKSLTNSILGERKRAEKAELKASAAETELKLVKQTSNEEIAQLNQKMSRAKEEKDKSDLEYSKDKANLNSQLSEKSKEMASLKDKLNSIQTEITALKNQLADAKSVISAAQQELAKASSLEEEYRAKLEEIKQAPIEELAALRRENDSLKHEMGNIETRILSLKKGQLLEKSVELRNVQPLTEIDKIFENALARLNEIEAEAIDLELKAKNQ